MLRAITLSLVSILLVFILFNRFNWKENKVFFWDIAGYYRYLPAVFIYDDLGKFEFSASINQQYGISKGVDFYALHPQPETGRNLNKYSVGVAVFELPAFLLAHGLTLATHGYAADGFSAFYRLFVALGNIFWVISGLWFLWKLLRRYYPDRVVAPVIVLTLFGTNLYNYTVFEPGMSHPYAFFLLAALLELTDRSYRNPKTATLRLLGLLIGLTVIVRPTNALALIFPVFWTINSRPSLKERLLFFSSVWKSLIAAAFCCLAILMLQFAYWKFATGHWIHYSYEGEGFNFRNPEIINGLFSVRKGLFVYTPLALLSLSGLILMFRQQPRQALLVLVYLSVSVYVMFSWSQWYYGGGFGCRPMVENYAVLSLPLAALINGIFAAKRMVMAAASLVLALCVALNAWQTYQYTICVLPVDGTTWSYYKRVFFKVEKSAEDDRIFKTLAP